MRPDSRTNSGSALAVRQDLVSTCENENESLSSILEMSRRLFTEYLHVPLDGAEDLLTVFSFGTHLFECFESYPYIILQGTKESGKTRCLELLGQVCARPMNSASITPAVAFRVVEERYPTLLLDEAEALASGRGELSQIVKTGYKRGACVYRYDTERKRIRGFPTYCPKVLASTRSFNDIIASRSILLLTHRTRRHISDNAGPEFERACQVLRDAYGKVADLIRPRMSQILEAERRLCALQGRQRELWLPLFATARALGGDVLRARLDRVRKELLLQCIVREREENPDLMVLVALRYFLEESEGIQDRHGTMTDWHSAHDLLKYIHGHHGPVVRKLTGLTQALQRLGVLEPDGSFQTYKRLDSEGRKMAVGGTQTKVYCLDGDRVRGALVLHMEEESLTDV